MNDGLDIPSFLKRTKPAVTSAEETSVEAEQATEDFTGTIANAEESSSALAASIEVAPAPSPEPDTGSAEVETAPPIDARASEADEFLDDEIVASEVASSVVDSQIDAEDSSAIDAEAPVPEETVRAALDDATNGEPFSAVSGQAENPRAVTGDNSSKFEEGEPEKDEPRGSRKTDFAKSQLRSLVERIERLEEEKKAISEDIKAVYAEAKANGFDTKILRKTISIRKKDRHEREEEEAMLELYLGALGMV